MIDYVLDTIQLMDALGEAPALVIGHSLGAEITPQYAGVYPDHVKAMIAIEGLGPSPSMIREAAADQRMRVRIGEMQALASRHPHHYASIEQALRRMREVNPRLSLEQARHLTVQGMRRNEDGTYS